MTASEIVMKRDDPNIAWGFRLTGGADLGTPFFVVKVLGRGHAERAGLRVGDMVYAINHKYVNTYTHKDAQNIILHTGDTLTLNIRRGPFSGRGTPLPEYIDPLMGLAPPPEVEIPKLTPLPPYEPPPVVRVPSPPESEEEEEEDEEEPEETVAAFTVKINPKGRIAAIEEVPITPPPSRSTSRCRSRSRSASRDHSRSRKSSTKHVTAQRGSLGQAIVQHSDLRQADSVRSSVENGFVPGPGGVSGPGESFTYSKEVVTQYSTVLSAAEQTDGQTSEMVNESFIIHGGSQHKMEDILSPEDIERDIFEEKMEEQKITELLTGEAEVLDQGVVGINFQKIIPKTEFIKDSEVFKHLQDQIVKKVEPEEVQLQKDPNKRFSTFLQTPKRPIPEPKPKDIPPPTLMEDFPRRQSPPELFYYPPQQQIQQHVTSQQEETIESSTTQTQNYEVSEGVYIQEVSEWQTNEEQLFYERMQRESYAEDHGQFTTETVCHEDISNENVRFEEEAPTKKDDITDYMVEHTEQLESNKAAKTNAESDQTSFVKTEKKSVFEQQLEEIRKQMEAIQQLPSLLQANLQALQDQLNKVVESKVAADQKEGEEDAAQGSDGVQSQPGFETIEEMREEREEAFEVEETMTTNIEEVAEEEEAMVNGGSEFELEDSEVAQTIQNGLNEQYENKKNQELHQKQREENPSVAKPAMIRNFPHNVQERPIVLPGGRKWYKPKDAYNEDFIAETIIHQSEVLIGTTIGMNFCKYEPPKFDAANSAVYRLVREIEGRKSVSSMLPIEQRPEKVLAEQDYFPPISKRHFFAARLTEQIEVPENIDKILHDDKEEGAIFV